MSTATAAASQAGTTSRKGPVPKVKVNQSHAYGSTAKLDTAGDVSVPVAAFSQAFENQRGAVALGDESSDESDSSSPIRHSVLHQFSTLQKDTVQNGQYATNAQNSTDLSLSWDHEDLAGGRTLSYLQHETDKYAQGVAANAGISSSSSESDVSEHLSEPPSAEYTFQAFLDLVSRHWLLILKSFGAVVALLVMGYILIGTNVQHSSARVPSIEIPSTRALPFRLSHAFEYLKHSFSGNMTRFERKTKEFEESLRRFSQALPPEVAVRKGKNGQLEVDDQFYQALVNKLEEDGNMSTRNGRNNAWRNFIKDNDEFLRKNTHQRVDELVLEHLDERFDKALEQREILSRDEFIELLQKDYLKLSDKVDQEIEKMRTQIKKETKASIWAATNDAVAKISVDQIRLQSLAYANLVANAELTLKNVNYFSHFLGAQIEPILTSPTYRRPEPPLTWKIVLFKIFWQPVNTRRGPAHALTRWEEPTECWCAAPSEKHGLLQLVVEIPNKVAPSKVVIEHVSKGASPRIGTAPKDIDFWGYFPDPKDFNAAMRLSAHAGVRCEANNLPEKYVCLGRFLYDIDAPNHIQIFNLAFDLGELGIGAAAFLVLVNENWGADHTCLYRVRLLGQEVGGGAVYPREL
jgi:hypothetical protein